MTLRLPDKEYAELCAKVLDRDLWKCKSCGFRGNLHVHHIVYRSQQGLDESWNLITLCFLCHEAVHTRNLQITQQGLQTVNANLPVHFVRLNNWRPK